MAKIGSRRKWLLRSCFDYVRPSLRLVGSAYATHPAPHPPTPEWGAIKEQGCFAFVYLIALRR